MEMTMDFTIETIKDNLKEVQDLSELHYLESAPYFDIPLKVDWEKVLKLERLNVLKTYFMKKSSKIIGYASFSLGPSLEYKTSYQASLFNIFLHPDYRGGGRKFIAWCDEQLQDLGVQVVYHHVKARNDYGVLLKRLGYVKMNIEYSKRLDKD